MLLLLLVLACCLPACLLAAYTLHASCHHPRSKDFDPLFRVGSRASHVGMRGRVHAKHASTGQSIAAWVGEAGKPVGAYFIDDVWQTAVRLADGAAGVAVGPAPQRVSCCFIYALPGMRECASCPRRGRN